MTDKSRFRTSLEGLNDEQFARVKSDFEAEAARRNPPKAPDFASMNAAEFERAKSELIRGNN